MIDINIVLNATAKAAEHGDFVGIREYSRITDSSRNECLLFFKPEVAEPIGRLQAVWNLVQDVLDRFECETVAAAACGARYLRQHHVFEHHYGVINQVSVNGLSAVAGSARNKIEELVTQQGRDGLKVLGGHQFLKDFPAYTPKTLAALYDGLPLHRFAGGTYGVITAVEAQRVLLLNGFHPNQLEEYYTDGRVILNLVLRSPASWKALRQELTGVTNPSKAHPNSIRGLLLRRQSELGLPEVNSMRNGVHLSAGPVEAIGEISRFMSDQDSKLVLMPASTTLGHEVKEIGGLEVLEALCANATVRYRDASESAFDLTEEWDSSAILRAISEHTLVPLVG